MKYILGVVLIVFVLQMGCSQNKAAPAYLINQKFPDSIGQVTVKTVAGVNVSLDALLKEHHGKKVVLDFWASWCSDCLKGLPVLKGLQKETKEVVYVFLSLDKTESRWKKALERLKIPGEHYYIADGFDSPLADYVKLDWIPRYMVLDEEGTIINAKAVKASDEKFRTLLLNSKKN